MFNMKFPAFEPIDLKNNVMALETYELAVSNIIPDENQSRKFFDENALEELALSIKQHGIIQPVIVRSLDNSEKYQLIAGERRWRAAMRAGLDKVPAIIREYSKLERMAVALIENIQREDLNPLEEAQAIQSLLEECAMTHHQIAVKIGRSRASVTNLLRLLNLEPEVKIMLESGLLEMGHARALLSISGAAQIDVAKLIISKKLSVRETEKLLQRINISIPTQQTCLAPEFGKRAQEWKAYFSKQLASKVNLYFSPDGKGRVVIHFNSLEKADWLMTHLNLNDSVKLK